MAWVYISLGSNIDREELTRAGVDALQKRYGELVLSSVYESEAVGFEGDSFYNMVIGLQTDDDVLKVAQALRLIEDENGRDRSGPRFSSRTLDLDLLLYDDLIINQDKLQIPRDEILLRAFVLWPMAEVAPDLTHPEVNKTYAELWSEFDKEKEKLEPIEFDFVS
ncbi:MAG: 2-amino-4-hydroxy-6-hydroxymethyldihydropteridine diphosphokinase [endosymbiont of Galathealinum brachiosum]|uniref:2-amino-4-hydroxy-6-hydroxymethyldihydropteridine diphosphokinase n=1 Tax=endosymbiont of Galathealinum brachiosum TaxID=2200906 RepID=A0A370DF22_9GAMM|nr:MAG: 2-amino-4-hydroxy-6-hydroxymethyldihydropteridine diphosphokinase [endosymbiont of Galathealinum brachiosum]